MGEPRVYDPPTIQLREDGALVVEFDPAAAQGVAELLNGGDSAHLEPA